eukprot:Skav207372  [mRNA]  locus=scaffold3618:117959:118324:- [translate_table: standard]
MLVDEARWGEIIEKGETIQPYMDEILRKNDKEYHGFKKMLFDKNLISFTGRPRGLVTPFFIAKKNKKPRFILDCRSVNKKFNPPPPLAMAAGSTWGSIALPPGEVLCTAQPDIRLWTCAAR